MFNHECWLLLLGLPNDYWTKRHIHSIVGEFARVLLWVADDRFRCRLLISARVTDLEKVPQFIVYADPDTIDRGSWTLQCEVLQHHPQQQGPPIEDPIPEDVDMEAGAPFDFFGLGQPVNGLNGQGELIDNQQQDAWDPWSAEILAQQQSMQDGPLLVQDLNEAPVINQHGQLDLNEPAVNQDINQDQHLVIFNPVMPEGNEGNVENMHGLHLLQSQGEVFILNPLEEELMQIADEEMQLEAPNVQAGPPVPPVSPVNHLDDEIPLDQLLGSDDEVSSEQPEQMN